MAKPKPGHPVALDLYALITHLNTTCNRDLLDAILASGLSYNELRLLERLRTGRRPTIAQAATMLHVDPSGASRVVDRLARRKLVVREGDERDYRAKRIVITERGQDVITQLHAARLDRVLTFAETLDDQERELLSKALAKLAERDAIAACRPAA